MAESKIYNNPLYYDIAFDFRDIKKQVNLFEEFIKKYSKIKVKKVLDIACGPAGQLLEFARRGYKAVGLDSSAAMLGYLGAKEKQGKIKIKKVQKDMANFKLKERADFAYILMGSIIYLKNNNDFLKHLNSVSASLNKGGLYLIENMPLDWDNKEFYKPQTWTMKKDGITVMTAYQIGVKDTLKQTILQTIKLNINDHGKKTEFVDQDELKLIFPQELISLVRLNGTFEFLGWFERDRIAELGKAKASNIVLLRKK
ncbi:class I SAM-dependent methyltransferase [Candidatus Kuenenbacteria bacterium]|nr:class I SAM-dependent methyltransferase [Candidatus Kuenenbacteria bacterium]